MVIATHCSLQVVSLEQLPLWERVGRMYILRTGNRVRNLWFLRSRSQINWQLCLLDDLLQYHLVGVTIRCYNNWILTFHWQHMRVSCSPNNSVWMFWRAGCIPQLGNWRTQGPSILIMEISASHWKKGKERVRKHFLLDFLVPVICLTSVHSFYKE